MVPRDSIDAFEALAALDSFDAGLDAVTGVDLVGLDRDGLLEVLRRFEATRRRMAVLDHSLIAELDDRKVAHELCMPNTAALLRGALRISPADARRRVRAAAELGPRRTLTGEVLPPLLALVAGSQAEGIISPDHAAVIITAMHELPHQIRVGEGMKVEASLVQVANAFDPSELSKYAHRLTEVLNPDGALADDADHERRRDLRISRRNDGSFDLAGRLTPECGALAHSVLDSLAAPRPATDGNRDNRTSGERLHDALRDALRRLLCSDLPDTGGRATTLLLTMTAEQFQTGRGYASTGHGDLITTGKALQLAADGQVMTILIDHHGAILDYGMTRRIVPPAMRLAITARDRGCTFPGCDRPPAWCEAHHFREFADGGPTSVGNTGLVCRFHHRNFAEKGWRGVMINGIPHWIPPAHIDPDRTPRRNHFTNSHVFFSR
jgi:hypothetical protein